MQKYYEKTENNYNLFFIYFQGDNVDKIRI
ncbi:hypothetical protein FLJU110815_18470 [Flavobacterium jumunjinense]|jgi:hypothetical protein